MDFLRPSVQKRKVANMFYQSKNEKKAANLSMFFKQPTEKIVQPTDNSNSFTPIIEEEKV